MENDPAYSVLKAACRSLAAHVSIGAFVSQKQSHLVSNVLLTMRKSIQRRDNNSILRVISQSNRSFLPILFGIAIVFGLAGARPAAAQETSPVERKITNPITDTPNVNPLQQDQPVRPTSTGKPPSMQPGDELIVNANKKTVSGTKGAVVAVYEGNVDARIGTYRLQADKITVYEATNKVVAEGNVVFDQGDQQRITGSRAEWNYKTKTGFFVDSTGYTNQTQDGTRMYFTADRVEKISLDTIIIINGEVTACDEETPKWSFRAKRARIKTGDRVRLVSPTFRVKKIPIVYLPYASLSLKHQDRSSGFLTPTFSASGAKGFRLSEGYYLTLGRSADFTVRGDLFSKRGFGIGADLRTRANSRSFLNLGFYLVKDRVFGPKASATNPDQGGSSFYIDAVHYFPNGFLAAADVNITLEPRVSSGFFRFDPAGDLAGRTFASVPQQKLSRLQFESAFEFAGDLFAKFADQNSRAAEHHSGSAPVAAALAGKDSRLLFV